MHVLPTAADQETKTTARKKLTRCTLLKTALEICHTSRNAAETTYRTEIHSLWKCMTGHISLEKDEGDFAALFSVPARFVDGGLVVSDSPGYHDGSYDS